eukprot:3511823-Rhodomonas_salina.1
MSVGLPPPPSARLAAAGVLCGGKCKALYHAAGHHAQTCELSVRAGVPATILPSKLPTLLLTGDDRHADIKWDWPGQRGVAIVGDKSALSPFVGKGKSTQWGTYRPQKLQDRVNCKNRTYAAFHCGQNMQFVPLVGTTLGLLGANAVAMSWVLAHRAAEKAFLARGLNTVSPTTGKYSPQFLQLRSCFEHRNTARLSLALCRGGCSRGLPASAPHRDRADADLVEALEVASSSRRRS